MGGCVHLYSRSYKHIITDYYRVTVVKDAAIVDADVIADMDVVSEPDYCAVSYRNIRAYILSERREAAR